MKIDRILSRVYRSSSMVIVPIVMLTCLLCKWPFVMITIALLASIAICSPAMLSLQILIWMFQKIHVEQAFAWMLLFSFIPLWSFIVAWLLADFVPGKIWFVLLIAMFSGYIGLLKHGISVSQFFKSIQNGREENHSID